MSMQLKATHVTKKQTNTQVEVPSKNVYIYMYKNSRGSHFQLLASHPVSLLASSLWHTATVVCAQPMFYDATFLLQTDVKGNYWS